MKPRKRGRSSLGRARVKYFSSQATGLDVMLARSTKPKPSDEASQPLLNSSEEHLAENDSNDEDILFSAEGDDSNDDLASTDPQTSPKNRGSTRSVRFEDDVHIIAPSLRSTTQSRETEFDLDSEDLDDDVFVPDVPGGREQTMPLLVGLLDSSQVQRGFDGSISLSHNGDVSRETDADLEELMAKRLRGGGLLDSIANMANSILGAGIIGLPYAIRQAGFFTGIFLLVALCVVTDWTIRLIVINAKLSGRNSYIDIMHHCFGSSGRAAVSFFQFSFAFGGMCAFGIIIGDTIPHVIRSIFPNLHNTPVASILTDRKFIIFFCTACVSYPLSLYRDIHKLSRASGLALIGMLIIVTSVLIRGPQVSPELKGDPGKRLSFLEPGIFRAVGVISFAFVCHHNSLLIYGSMRTPTIDRFALVTHISTFFSLLSCCTLAISAFWVFTNKTQGNILNNFSSNDTLINVARFCFGMNMFTTLPLELFVCREVIEQFFFSHEGFNPQRHLFFTTVILFASLFVALITCDLGVMLEITGGVSATALAYIFPAACYIWLLSPLKPWYSRDKLPAVFCAAFGIVVMSISLFLALGKVWTPEGEPKICV